MSALSPAMIPAPMPASRRPEGRRRHSVLTTVLVAAGLGSAWLVGRLTGLTAGSDAGYWLGVAGGLTTLALFAYPIRKRAGWLRRAGSTKGWFIGHMVLGIAGPWLILVHCNFQVGSLNAAIALSSMLIVAASGVVGRFLYVRVHRGLTGQRAELQELRAALRAENADVAARLGMVPAACARLLAFEQQTLTDHPDMRPWRLLTLWWPAGRTLRAVRGDIRAALSQQASPASRGPLRRAWSRQARSHVDQVIRVAQFSVWERLFALWHVLHVPFVYLMVVCAVVHVVAVHAY